MAQKTSRVTVKVDGDTLSSKAGSASAKMGGLYRENDEMTDQGVYVYQEKWIPSEISCTLIHTSKTDLPKLLSSANVTVTYETDTGVTYTQSNSVCKTIGDLKDGEVDITFGGDPLK